MGTSALLPLRCFHSRRNLIKMGAEDLRAFGSTKLDVQAHKFQHSTQRIRELEFEVRIRS